MSSEQIAEVNGINFSDQIVGIYIDAGGTHAFDDPGGWLGRQVEIAGDELTGTQMAEAFERVSGIPARYEQRPIEPLRAAREDLAAMFDWMDREGYRADLPELRRIRPDLIGLETWLRTNWTAPAAAPAGAPAGARQ